MYNCFLDEQQQAMGRGFSEIAGFWKDAYEHRVDDRDPFHTRTDERHHCSALNERDSDCFPDEKRLAVDKGFYASVEPWKEEHEDEADDRTTPTQFRTYTDEQQISSACSDLHATTQSPALKTARTNTMPYFGHHQTDIPYRFYLGDKPETSDIHMKVEANLEHSDQWNPAERRYGMDSTVRLNLDQSSGMKVAIAQTQHPSSYHGYLSFETMSRSHHRDLDGQQVDWLPGHQTNPAFMATGHISHYRGLLKLDTFPQKLMHALLSNARHQDTFIWLPGGSSFSVVNRDLFVSKVLSTVFRETKYTSFVRKLRRWGFSRLSAAFGHDAFHHSLFDFNFPERASLISCTPNRTSVNQQKVKDGMEAPSVESEGENKSHTNSSAGSFPPAESRPGIVARVEYRSVREEEAVQLCGQDLQV